VSEHMMKVILFAVGALAGGILGIALSHFEILGASFDGRWVAVAFAIGGLILGNHIDNKREAARIARELNEDRARFDQQA
jgi:uncharacterized protein YcfJ